MDARLLRRLAGLPQLERVWVTPHTSGGNGPRYGPPHAQLRHFGGYGPPLLDPDASFETEEEDDIDSDDESEGMSDELGGEAENYDDMDYIGNPGGDLGYP